MVVAAGVVGSDGSGASTPGVSGAASIAPSFSCGLCLSEFSYTQSISCEECNAMMCASCDLNQHPNLHMHTRWLHSDTGGRRGLEAEEFLIDGAVMRVRSNVVSSVTSWLTPKLTAMRSCSACEDGVLVPYNPSSQDMIVWTEKGGFRCSKPLVRCNSQICSSEASSAATAHDILHFFSFKSLSPIAANVVLTSALVRSWLAASDGESLCGIDSLVHNLEQISREKGRPHRLDVNLVRCLIREERRFDEELGKLRRPPSTLFRCAACEPTAAAICVDGNFKIWHYRREHGTFQKYVLGEPGSIGALFERCDRVAEILESLASAGDEGVCQSCGPSEIAALRSMTHSIAGRELMDVSAIATLLPARIRFFSRQSTLLAVSPSPSQSLPISFLIRP
ncbi:hypothetical protein T492DRAFT_239309 [Pavlovales sp. CCMP2436]|nr:hypothetical protein T492DRAFT_239309 [Pavlovales sp. CCMP2436]|mmetsp:Transcript_19882/g.50637  ORF Transcript_19882/g.50637 Transcript_19882/m.50637 type:complete len:394 (-) Transcript_19882:325-1506(-)